MSHYHLASLQHLAQPHAHHHSHSQSPPPGQSSPPIQGLQHLSIHQQQQQQHQQQGTGDYSRFSGVFSPAEQNGWASHGNVNGDVKRGSRQGLPQVSAA
jgi:hypothetical protein